MMKGSYLSEINAFAQEAFNLWVPFVTRIIEMPLPPSTDESTKGLVTLKIQAVRVCCLHVGVPWLMLTD
jgi:hypothetical protein